MKISTTVYVCIGCAILTAIIVSCSKDNDEVTPDADRTALVENLGNNIIIPNFQALSASTNALNDAVVAFNAAPGEATLEAAQQKFKAAYTAWQHCAPFNFGPAEQALLDKNVNIFPANADKINTNIMDGGYNLDQLSNLDAKGFPALDYLLFGIEADNATIVAQYTINDKASERKQYLAAVSANAKTQCNTVLNGWLASGGNYADTFIKATGTDIGSALGQLVNGMAYDLDQLKNYEVAIPVGIIPLTGKPDAQPIPSNVQAYYSGISVALLSAEVTGLQDIYLGRSSQSDGEGLDDYLVENNISYHGGSLNDAINSQFAAVFAKLNTVPDPLSSTIATSPASVTSLYTELQKLLVLLKSDMPSSMGIQITFEDNDGD